ncbi:MAG: hypothetical protein KIH03_06950 [Paludibacteraceae bacterium]|nr:hypothetical protein [Paludibacteraceae bacterium]
MAIYERVKFGDIDSLNDLGLTLNTVDIQPPTVKTNYVNLPSGGGVLDFTEQFGEVFYANRIITFHFHWLQTDLSGVDVLQKTSEVIGKLHGQRFDMVIGEDWTYLIRGRVSVATAHIGRFLEITVTADCEPYFEKSETSVHQQELTEGESVDFVINNEGDKNVPLTVTFNDSFSMELEAIGARIVIAGTEGMSYTIRQFRLKEGANHFTAVGDPSGTVVFKWQEGVL